MIPRTLTGLMVALLLCTVACKSDTDYKEAIRTGVVKHLSSKQGLNVPNMEITVTQLSVNGNQATAQVEIRAKGAENSANTMNLSYNLEKRGNEWAVIKGTPAGGSLQHPAPSEMPYAGHPSTSSGGSVHSDFSEILKSGQTAAQPPPPQSTPAQPGPPAAKPLTKP